MAVPRHCISRLHACVRLSMLVAVMTPAPASAQQIAADSTDCRALPADISDPAYDALRLEPRAQFGSRLLRRLSALPSCAPDAALTAWSLPLRVHLTHNSAYPVDRNNGALWAGRGAGTSVAAGFGVEYGPVSLRVQPAVVYVQNDAFATKVSTLPGFSRFVYLGHPLLIDWPQRFGEDPYLRVTPGQSSLRVRAFGFDAGVATENLWIGPALRNPLLLSNTAEGFPHAFIGTATPVATPIGDFGATLFWGRLSESDYFDDDEDNDHRILHGALLEYACRCLPGLTLGAARLYTTAEEGAAAEILLRPYRRSADRPAFADNGMFAFYAHYYLAAARAELYAEWAHEVPYKSLADALREPDQSQAYTIGFQKEFPGGAGRSLRVYGELTHLERAGPSYGGRPTPTFYTHSTLRQGHTHRGQMLGAWIGPGSDAQLVGVAVRRGRLDLGVYAERVRFDADAYYDQWSRYYGPVGLDVQLAGGVRPIWQVRPDLQLGIDASYAQRFSRNFILLTGVQPGTFGYEHNLQLDLQASWKPMLSLATGRRANGGQAPQASIDAHPHRKR